MIRRFFLMVLAVLAIVSCKEKLIDPPENLISQEEMTEILYDLALIKGLNATNMAMLKKYNIKTMPYLYDKYGIDSLQFVHSDQYYASIPEKYQQMYQTIQEHLENQIKEMDEAREQRSDSLKKRSDSLRKQTGKIKDSLKAKAKASSAPSKK